MLNTPVAPSCVDLQRSVLLWIIGVPSLFGVCSLLDSQGFSCFAFRRKCLRVIGCSDVQSVSERTFFCFHMHFRMQSSSMLYLLQI